MQLSVPQRTLPAEGAFDSRPASVKHWIDALPMANTGSAARQLFATINELNHQAIPVQQRFRTLELLCKPIHYITDSMKKHFIGQPLPLSASAIRIAHLSREMNAALATGYKVLVMEQIGAVDPKDTELLVTAIYRAVKQLGLVLLNAGQVYEPYPDSVWLELHSLYHYAENHQLQDNRITDRQTAQGTPTIATAYKQILLLALAQPYRMHHREAEAVYLALEQWASLAKLQAADDTSAALFTIDLNTDQPPAYLKPEDSGRGNPAHRTLNTQPLAHEIQQTLAGKTNARIPARQTLLNKNTLHDLLRAWSQIPKRRFSRVSEHTRVVVSMGLSSLHYFIAGEVVFNDASIEAECRQELGTNQPARLQGPARFQARKTREEIARQPDVWSVNYRIPGEFPDMEEINYRLQGEAPPSSTELAVKHAALEVQIDTSHCTQNWKIVNVSAGGCCMYRDYPETTRAQVGELLGIREQGTPDTFHWRIGVVRWLKHEEKQGLKLGIEMLSPSAVAIAACREQPEDTDYTRGLLLPDIATIQQQATLLLPSLPFVPEETVIINCHGRDVRVKLTRLVENTGLFARFEYEPLGEIQVTGQAPSEGKPEPNEFDDIWELL